MTTKNASRQCNVSPTPLRISRSTNGHTEPHRGEGLAQCCTEPTLRAETRPGVLVTHAEPWPPGTPNGAQTRSRRKRAEHTLEMTGHLGESRVPGPEGLSVNQTVSSRVYTWPKPSEQPEAALAAGRAFPSAAGSPCGTEGGLGSCVLAPGVHTGDRCRSRLHSPARLLQRHANKRKDNCVNSSGIQVWKIAGKHQGERKHIQNLLLP